MIKMHAGWLGGALFALGLATASAQSGEVTGCLGDRGTLTKVAPGARPAAPCGANARKVSVPVAINAGRPGSARVDSYTFWQSFTSRQSTPGFGNEVFWLPGRHVGFYARCLLQRVGEHLQASAEVLPGGFFRDVIRDEGQGVRTEPDTPFVVASAEGRDLAFGDPWLGLGFVSARDIFTLVAEDYWLKLEIVTTMQTGTVGPARCTFSGTAELVRK